MIKYAGYNLLLPDDGGELQAWLDRYAPIGDILPTLTPTSLTDGRTRPQGSWPHSVGLPTFNWSQQPPEWKLNTLWWPTGASRHAIGLFLADYATVQQIQGQLGDDGSATLDISDGTTTVSPTMFLLPPRPLAPVLTGSNPPCLLILVDKRYFWQWSKLGAVAYGPSTTWADVLGDINSALGISVSATASADYLNADWSEWVRQYENAAVAMDAWAASTGHRFAAQTNGTYALQGFSDAESLVDSNLNNSQRVAGHSHVVATATAPGTLTVAFAKRQGGIPHQRGDCYQVTKNASDYGWDDDAPGAAVIHSACQADFSSRSADPDNASQLSTLAGRIATDFYGWKRKQYSATIPGVADWTLSGFDDFLWLHVGYQPKAGPECPCDSEQSSYTFHTRIESLPPSFGFEEQLSQRSATKTFRPMPVFRARLTSAFQENGDGIYQAAAQLLYDATSSTGAMSQAGTAVTVFDTLGMRANANVGSDLWVSALAADTNMFEVVSVAGEGLIRFQLYGGDLELAGEQTAKVCVIDGSDWFATDTIITVIDPYDPGTWQGKEGYQGFCVKRPPDKDTGVSDGKYDIVYMEEQAMFIEFEALEDRDPTLSTFEAKLEYWYHGRKPEVGEAEAITVYDTAKIFPRILDGCKGKAVWDDINKVYETYECQQQALIIRGIATSDQCSATQNLAFSSAVAMSNSPHGAMPDPLPTQAINIGLAVQTGDVIISAWDETAEDWRVVNVEHKERLLVTNVFIDGTCFKQTKIKAAVSTCEDDTGTTTTIEPCGEEC